MLSARLSLGLGLAAILVLLVLTGFLSLRYAAGLRESRSWVTHIYAVIETAGSLLSELQNAETGQRGYLITEDPRYLEPYDRTIGMIPVLVGRLKSLTRDNWEQGVRIGRLTGPLETKLQELAATIAVARADGFEAARAIVATDTGRTAMDALRTIIASLPRSSARKGGCWSSD